MRKTVLVTGSSSGIGKEIARILAKDYDIILHYNSNENSTRLLKKEFEWLKEVDSLVLVNAQQNLEKAYKIKLIRK